MTREELLALIDQAADEGWTELDLSGQNLTELPPEIGKLTQLETLILGKWNPKTRELFGNQLNELPPEISLLKNLIRLDISGNRLTQVPPQIAQLNRLSELSLFSNQLTRVPEAIGNLTSLKTLDLSTNYLEIIPEAIGNLTSLIELDLSRNRLMLIPDPIGCLSNLKRLYLSRNQIVKLSERITALINLEILTLHINQLTEIPTGISCLKSLKDFYLSQNQLKSIPESLGDLTDLIVLDMSQNQLRHIPDSFGNLANLKELYLWGNQLTEIPEVIGNLKNLTVLFLSRNQLTEIPEIIGNLKNLTVLFLSRNQLTEIPEVVGNLKNLTVLSLWDNQLTSISTALGNLNKLKELYLSCNQLKEIPKVLGDLENLTEFYLWNNQLSEVPQVIEEMKNLTTIDLSKNKITEIPSWLEDLPNLKSLDLRRNPLPISPKVLEFEGEEGSIEAIFNYCRQLRSGEVRPLNEAKLLLVGQGSVGKTSLIERLLYDRFDRHQRQTDGLDVRTWSVHVNSKDVRLNMWDFGGQEIYHSTHQFFLTKRSLYLLVCNCRTSEDENRIEYWLKLIESFGDQSPVIIVGNKCDEQPFDINRKALRDKYPNIKAILETSCETNQGLDELRQAIINEVGQLKEVYDLLPLSWFEVKEQLEAMDQDFISYSKYACICEAKNVTDEQSQEQLIDLLHRLGLVLNFRDHPILQTTTVLNPNWVTQGIYALLSDEILKTQTKGILTNADLSRILDPVAYPAARHHYLIELMREEKFQLCFQIPDCMPPTFLIPGLLSKEEPEDISLEGDTLEFYYHYRILPDSIVSRFIVLTHDKMHNAICWRSGVMLAYRQGNETYNVARVKADPEDRKIFISISGRETTRRVFLGILRDVFNKIHGSFGNLEVSEWVPVPGHPDHPPLDYQELLGLEDMGIRDYPIGKLKLKVNIRQLLDGYEPIEVRQRRRLGDDERIEYHIHGDLISGDKVGNDKVGHDKIGRNKIQRD
jgi:internalin A